MTRKEIDENLKNRAFELFTLGKSIRFVSKELRISYKMAEKLKRAYKLSEQYEKYYKPEKRL